MANRPWWILVGVGSLSGVLILVSLRTWDQLLDFSLGLGINLLSSILLFVLLDLYWERVRLVKGKEVSGFDYEVFSRNVTRSHRVRLLATFIYPLTDHPDYAASRDALLMAFQQAMQRPDFKGVEILLLHPESMAARLRAEERKDDAIIRRIREALSTLTDFQKRLDLQPGGDRFQVRLYTRTPPFALFQTDNFASISFYYRDRPISESARYEFFTDSPIGAFVEKTFDDLWLDERTVPLSSFVRSPLASDSHPDG